MAMIHINRSGTSVGTFSEEDVREGLRTGRFIGTDLGCREGMATWEPLSQFTEFATAPDTSAIPPSIPGSAIAPPLAGATATETPESRSGLPWEHRQERGFLNAFIETLQMVLSRPAEAFTAMKTEGGLGGPLIYALIGGCAGAIVSFLFSLGLNSMGFFAHRPNNFAALAGMG